MLHVTAADGLRLAYDDQGSGPPLLCLPGMTRNMDDFLPVLKRFGDRARIVRMDFRGRGASDYGDPATYAVPQEAADVLSLLDHLGIERTAILGTSRGGLVAMALAVTHKARLRGVILNDVGPVIEPEGIETILGYIGKIPAERTHAEVAPRLAGYPGFANVPDAAALAMARAIYREGPDGLTLRYDPALAERFVATYDPKTALQPAWPAFDALEGLPLALIRGANSELLSPATVAEMRRRRPDMAVAEVPDRGHVPFLDEPEAVALISDFLDRL